VAEPLAVARKAHLDQRFMDGSQGRGGNGPGRPVGYRPCPCRGMCGQIAAAPLSRCPGAAGRPAVRPVMADRNRHKPRRPRDHRGRRRWLPLLQRPRGFPALVDDPWSECRLTTLHACSDLWACGAGWRGPGPCEPCPERPIHCQEDAAARPFCRGCARARRPWRRAAGAATPCSSYRLAKAESALWRHAATPACGFLGPRAASGRRARNSHATDRARGCCSPRPMAGGAGPAGSNQALTRDAESQAGLLWEQAGRPHAAGLHLHFTGFGCWGHLGEMARRRGA